MHWESFVASPDPPSAETNQVGSYRVELPDPYTRDTSTETGRPSKQLDKSQFDVQSALTMLPTTTVSKSLAVHPDERAMHAVEPARVSEV